MKQFDFYNPINHKGFLPIRVLAYNALEWFEKITPEFQKEILEEIQFSELQQGIEYRIETAPIHTSAEITPEKKIILYENFNQFLWCMCYGLITLFDESIQKPILQNKYDGKFDLENPYVRRSIDVFNNGFSLFKTYRESVFFSLPNPEKYNEFDKFYIEKANGIYTAAMAFFLLHEFGHQFYKHPEYFPDSADESKKEELTADEYAFEKMASQFNEEKEFTNKCGIIAGLSSLIFFDKTLSGGTNHPDPDSRLKILIEQMELDELDNLWGIASLSFRLWAIQYNINWELPKEVENYKELFYLSLKLVNEKKEITTNNS
jgi:hypothetical protein